MEDLDGTMTHEDSGSFFAPNYPHLITPEC